MPRKQRFKPSRKPKPVGTQQDLMPMNDSPPVIEPHVAGSFDPGDVKSDALGRRDGTVPPASPVPPELTSEPR
jgi:hypothetical protein